MNSLAMNPQTKIVNLPRAHKFYVLESCAQTYGHYYADTGSRGLPPSTVADMLSAKLGEAAGTATAGTRGTATAGDAGTATAGEDGLIVLLHYDSGRGKYRKVVGVVGDGGIYPNVPYILDEHGKIIRKEKP